MKSIPLEIERKYLIRYPDTGLLASQEGCRVKRLTQTYLLSDKGSMRVRRVESEGTERFFRTLKVKISDMVRKEDEKEISQETYDELLLCADIKRRTITKTRYAFPYGGHTIEVDVFPFWEDRAFLEVELLSEDEAAELPGFLCVIKEVTEDPRYTNASLALEVITETL